MLLVAQLKNSTVVAFNWNGIGLKHVPLPSQELNYFDLKKASVIPNFGFINNNTIIKLNYELRWSSKLEDNEYKKMLETKSVLEVVLNK